MGTKELYADLNIMFDVVKKDLKTLVDPGNVSLIKINDFVDRYNKGEKVEPYDGDDNGFNYVNFSNIFCKWYTEYSRRTKKGTINLDKLNGTLKKYADLAKIPNDAKKKEAVERGAVTSTLYVQKSTTHGDAVQWHDAKTHTPIQSYAKQAAPRQSYAKQAAPRQSYDKQAAQIQSYDKQAAQIQSYAKQAAPRQSYDKQAASQQPESLPAAQIQPYDKQIFIKLLDDGEEASIKMFKKLFDDREEASITMLQKHGISLNESWNFRCPAYILIGDILYNVEACKAEKNYMQMIHDRLLSINPTDNERTYTDHAILDEQILRGLVPDFRIATLNIASEWIKANNRKHPYIYDIFSKCAYLINLLNNNSYECLFLQECSYELYFLLVNSLPSCTKTTDYTYTIYGSNHIKNEHVFVGQAKKFCIIYKLYNSKQTHKYVIEKEIDWEHIKLNDSENTCYKTKIKYAVHKISKGVQTTENFFGQEQQICKSQSIIFTTITGFSLAIENVHFLKEYAIEDFVNCVNTILIQKVPCHRYILLGDFNFYGAETSVSAMAKKMSLNGFNGDEDNYELLDAESNLLNDNDGIITIREKVKAVQGKEFSGGYLIKKYLKYVNKINRLSFA